MNGDAPRVIAHRGFAGIAPENTVGAFRAVTDGTHPASMIELDVIPCGDGTPVVFHDDRLDGQGRSRGITDGSGVVWETPLETVRSATILDSRESVPTLAEVFEALPQNVAVNVELKNPGTTDIRKGEALSPDEGKVHRDLWDPFVERVVGILSEFDNDVLFSSFAEGAVASVRDVAPSSPVALLPWDSIEDELAIAERYDCDAVHPPLNMICCRYFEQARHLSSPSFADIDLVERAHEQGLRVNVWTVRTWHEAMTAVDAGADGIIADYPYLLRWTA